MLTSPGRYLVEVPVSRDLLEAVLDSVEEGVWIGDPAGQTLLVNPNMAHLLCVGYSQLAAGSLTDLVGPLAQQQLKICLRNNAMGLVARLTIILVGADGRTTLLHVYCRPRYDKDGRYLGPILTATPSPTCTFNHSTRNLLEAGALPGADALSARERQVISYLAQGDRVPAIASHLGISQSTTRTHLSSAFRKLGVSSQQQFSTLLQGGHTPPAVG